MNKQLGLSVGEIAKYAIPINGLIPESENAVGEYAMVGYATDVKGNAYVAVLSVEHYSDNVTDMKILDVGHSVSGRIKKGGSPLHTHRDHAETLPFNTPANITIADLIDDVKSTHRSILSQNVLEHFNEERPKDGCGSD